MISVPTGMGTSQTTKRLMNIAWTDSHMLTPTLRALRSRYHEAEKKNSPT